MLSSIIYYSVRSKYCSDNDIQDILASSNKNNLPDEITGLLLYSDKHFIQYLEGEYNKIRSLYQKILEDKRHKRVTLLNTAVDIPERICPKWAMGSKKINKNHIDFSSNLRQEDKLIFNRLINGKIDTSEEISQIITMILRDYQLVA